VVGGIASGAIGFFIQLISKRQDGEWKKNRPNEAEEFNDCIGKYIHKVFNQGMIESCNRDINQAQLAYVKSANTLSAVVDVLNFDLNKLRPTLVSILVAAACLDLPFW
jgi:hypothetical protein